MKNAFSTSWKSSSKPSKQRKYAYNAPLHIRQKFVSAHLSKELRQKYKKRAIQLCKGDKVKILRGQFSGRENKIERIDLKQTLIYISGVERSKKDGTKSLHPVHPSNLLITELNLNDKERKAKLEKTIKVQKQEVK